jgi:hypothetical protein
MKNSLIKYLCNCIYWWIFIYFILFVFAKPGITDQWLQYHSLRNPDVAHRNQAAQLSGLWIPGHTTSALR